jgi:protoheme IX farnesyltransferase
MSMSQKILVTSATFTPRMDIRSRIARIKDFATLAKPEITLMVMISSGLACMLGSNTVQVVVLLNVTLGTGLVAGSAGVLNQYFERSLDARMRRTSKRPLPAGQVTAREALLFGVLLSVSGTIYLFFFINALTGLLGLATLVTYLFGYTPLKTKTTVCTLIGAFPGAAPVLMGWAAAQNNLAPEAWGLYLILFLWQFPHFYAIGWLYREDYARAGMKMLPAIDGDDGKTTFRRILISTQLLIIASLLFTLAAPASLLYLVIASSLGLSFYYVVYRASVSRSKLAAKTLLHASVIYLPLLYLAMLLDKVYLSRR